MWILEGRHPRDVDVGWAELVRGYDRVVLDAGTGDGRYVLARARLDGSVLAIGVDANGPTMARSARRAGRHGLMLG